VCDREVALEAPVVSLARLALIGCGSYRFDSQSALATETSGALIATFLSLARRFRPLLSSILRPVLQ